MYPDRFVDSFGVKYFLFTFLYVVMSYLYEIRSLRKKVEFLGGRVIHHFAARNSDVCDARFVAVPGILAAKTFGSANVTPSESDTRLAQLFMWRMIWYMYDVNLSADIRPDGLKYNTSRIRQMEQMMATDGVQLKYATYAFRYSNCNRDVCSHDIGVLAYEHMFIVMRFIVNGKRVYVFAFIGTSNLAEFISDISTDLAPYDYGKNDDYIFLHKGFMYSTVDKTTVRAGAICNGTFGVDLTKKYNVRMFVNEILRTDCNSAPDAVYITGHSLGGAKAIVLYIDILNDLVKRGDYDMLSRVYVCVFGSPRITNTPLREIIADERAMDIVRRNVRTFVCNNDYSNWIFGRSRLFMFNYVDVLPECTEHLRTPDKPTPWWNLYAAVINHTQYGHALEHLLRDRSDTVHTES